ncbi:methylase [Planctomycetales bacterium]|nr:methylase [Planctomycetales bacterium]
MTLSLNEIRTRAAAFVNGWKEKSPQAKEEADAQTFEAEFLNIFGISRKQQAIFEYKVQFDGVSDGQKGYIDLFWKGHILIEMKTPGKNLQKAYQQAKTYASALLAKDLPRGILICDFGNFHYYDLTKDAELHAFTLDELPQNIDLFGYLAGYRDVELKEADPVNIEAAELMGKLHDRLKDIGYSGHQLEMYLVRILFCLFADDTGIFDKHDLFLKYIIQRTNVDGSDLAMHIERIFDTLNKPKELRLKTIDEQLNEFPFINGGLFEERLDPADFDSKMRDTLIECCSLDWGKISPAIFGAMFQSIKDKDARRALGEHYTSEENILKLIKPLFLDALWTELAKIKKLRSAVKKQRLTEFHDKIAALKFLDPACGCGNFLVVSYRELRLLEIEVIRDLFTGQQSLDVELMVRVNVDQFYGIEIEDFPAEIAKTAMWLIDHLMNNLVSATFGKYYMRIPLTTGATIVNTNALPLDWEKVVPKNELSFILGNPPFVGARLMAERQKKEVELVFDNTRGVGELDYVCCWYKKAAQYMQDTTIECGFVSTNSICQGEQVSLLWQDLMNRHGIKINFAHQTFKWSNEARGKAAVYCVIVGFSQIDRTEKNLCLYETVTSSPIETTAAHLNAYLIDAPSVFIGNASKPLCNVSKMVFGSMPNDGGHFLLDETEKKQLLAKEPAISKLIRPFVGADEFINGTKRYCIWLKGVSPAKYSHSKEIQKRITAVKAHRLASASAVTRKQAEFPMLFVSIRQPDTNYLLVPRVSSEKRAYIPIGFLKKNIIAGDSTLLIPNATLYEFGIITSRMHMAWMRYVCGRLKSDYRYSVSIVYNNFPWPVPTNKQKAAIEAASQAVLDARLQFSNTNYAELYNPLSMPTELRLAHKRLDKAVEKAYKREFANDAERVAHLFGLHHTLTANLLTEGKKKRSKRITQQN